MDYDKKETEERQHIATSTNSLDNEPEDPSRESGIENDLANFREKWQNELRISPKHASQNNLKIRTGEDQHDDHETRAKQLFLKGIEMEKTGKLYEAIQFYRKAVQIVPDIEFKLDNVKPKLRENDLTDFELDEENNVTLVENEPDNESDNEISEEKLLAHIQKKVVKCSRLCTPQYEQNATHINQIPVEIILYILRWVVSIDLDLRALEIFSSVCRGFYVCARDPEIWRLACQRVWGINCGPTTGTYKSWRDMFIERPRLQFNGCYISKTTYIRPGEDSFQDHLYRPWHLVAYYRYLRFFPEGKVLMLTTAEEPAQCVGMMKTRNARYPVLSGYYRLKDDKVTVIVQRQEKSYNFQGYKKNRRRGDLLESEQTFHMELQITNHHKKRHAQLKWAHYSVFTKTKKGDESTCNFDLLANCFPPLWFSRVKSFTAESDYPLS